MTNALRGFNMELNATNAQRVDDVYSKLAAMSASNVDELSIAMTKTASIAKSANMEFETTAAFLAQIIETTREAPETAGTALKTVIARFSEVKKLYSEGQLTGQDEEGEEININKVAAALKTAGIEMNEYFTGAKGLDEIFMELAERWDSLDLVQQRYIATMAAGSRQQSRFIALMSDYGRTMELVEGAQNATGASAGQFEKTQESLQSKLARLKDTWQEFSMGLANNQMIKGAVDALTGLLNILNKITESGSQTGSTIKKLIVMIGGFKLAKGAVNKGLMAVGSKLGTGMGIDRLINNNVSQEGGQGVIPLYRRPINKVANNLQKFNQTTLQTQKMIVDADTTPANAKLTTLKAEWEAFRASFRETPLFITVDESGAIAEITTFNGTAIALTEEEAAALGPILGKAAQEGAIDVKVAQDLIQKEIEENIALIEILEKEMAEMRAKHGISQLTPSTQDLQNMGDDALIYQQKSVDAGRLAQKKNRLLTAQEKLGEQSASKFNSGFNAKLSNTKLGAGFTKIAEAMGSSGGALAGAAYVAAFVAAIAAIAAIIYATYTSSSDYITKQVADSWEKTAKEFTVQAQAAEKKVSELEEAWTQLLDSNTELDNLVQGTAEWRKELNEVQNQIVAILQKYPELSEYLKVGENGAIELNDQGVKDYQEKIIKESNDAILRQGVANAYANYYNAIAQNLENFERPFSVNISSDPEDNRSKRQVFLDDLDEGVLEQLYWIYKEHGSDEDALSPTASWSNSYEKNKYSYDQALYDASFEQWLKENEDKVWKYSSPTVNDATGKNASNFVDIKYFLQGLENKRANQQANNILKNQIKGYSLSYLVSQGYDYNIANAATEDMPIINDILDNKYEEYGNVSPTRWKWANGGAFWNHKLVKNAAEELGYTYDDNGNKILDSSGNTVYTIGYYGHTGKAKDKDGVTGLSDEEFLRQAATAAAVKEAQKQQEAAAEWLSENENMAKIINGDLTANISQINWKGATYTDGSGESAEIFSEDFKTDVANRAADLENRQNAAISRIDNQINGLFGETGETDNLFDKSTKLKIAQKQNEFGSNLTNIDGGNNLLGYYSSLLYLDEILNNDDLKLDFDEKKNILDSNYFQPLADALGVTIEDNMDSDQLKLFAQGVSDEIANLEEVSKNIDFNSAINGAHQLQLELEKGSVGAERINTFLENGQFSAGNQITEFLNSKDFGDFSAKMSAIYNQYGSISADDVRSLGSEYQTLGTMLQTGTVKAGALAKMMEDVENHTISLSDVTVDLAEYYNNLYKAIDLAGDALAKFESHKIGRSGTELGGKYTEAWSNVQNLLDFGAYGDSQIGDYMAQMIGSKEWNDILNNSPNQLAAVETVKERYGLQYNQDHLQGSIQYLLRQNAGNSGPLSLNADGQIHWDLSDFDSLEEVVQGIVNQFGISKEYADAIVADMSVFSKDFSKQLNNLSKKDALKSFLKTHTTNDGTIYGSEAELKNIARQYGYTDINEFAKFLNSKGVKVGSQTVTKAEVRNYDESGYFYQKDGEDKKNWNFDLSKKPTQAFKMNKDTGITIEANVDEALNDPVIRSIIQSSDSEETKKAKLMAYLDLKESEDTGFIKQLLSDNTTALLQVKLKTELAMDDLTTKLAGLSSILDSYGYRIPIKVQLPSFDLGVSGWKEVNAGPFGNWTIPTGLKAGFKTSSPQDAGAIIVGGAGGGTSGFGNFDSGGNWQSASAGDVFKTLHGSGSDGSDVDLGGLEDDDDDGDGEGNTTYKRKPNGTGPGGGGGGGGDSDEDEDYKSKEAVEKENAQARLNTLKSEEADIDRELNLLQKLPIRLYPVELAMQGRKLANLKKQIAAQKEVVKQSEAELENMKKKYSKYDDYYTIEETKDDFGNTQRTFQYTDKYKNASDKEKKEADEGGLNDIKGAVDNTNTETDALNDLMGDFGGQALDMVNSGIDMAKQAIEKMVEVFSALVDWWTSREDWLYNLLSKIEQETRNFARLQQVEERFRLGSTEGVDELVSAWYAQKESLDKQIALEEELIASRKAELQFLNLQNALFSPAFHYDYKEERVIENPWVYDIYKLVFKMGSLVPEIGGVFSSLESWMENNKERMEKAVQEIEDAKDKILEIEKQQLELRQQYMDDEVSLEELVMGKIIEKMQEEIDSMTALSEAISEANSKLLETLQNNLEKMRQDRENANTEEELAKKERRLAYLRQDTSGANQVEIRKLEEELDKGHQDYTDKLIDQKITELQKQNDKAAAQREAQINLAQAQLDYTERYGLQWEEARELIKNGYDDQGRLRVGSELFDLLMSSEDFAGLGAGSTRQLSQRMEWDITGIAGATFRAINDVWNKGFLLNNPQTNDVHHEEEPMKYKHLPQYLNFLQPAYEALQDYFVNWTGKNIEAFFHQLGDEDTSPLASRKIIGWVKRAIANASIDTSNQSNRGNINYATTTTPDLFKANNYGNKTTQNTISNKTYQNNIVNYNNFNTNVGNNWDRAGIVTVMRDVLGEWADGFMSLLNPFDNSRSH